LIPPLVDLLQQMIGSICPLARHERLQLGVAFEQALQNALLRGNLEMPGPGLGKGRPVAAEGSFSEQEELDRRRGSPPYSLRKIYLLARIQPSEVSLHVRDEGPGFDHQRVLANISTAAKGGGPEEQSGRGLLLIQAFVDELQFLGKGNEVVLTKRCSISDDNRCPTVSSSASRRSPQRNREKDVPREGTVSPAYATLRAVEGNQTWTLTTRRATIGRDPSCDIVVSHMDVSAHHCQLFLREGWWFVADLRTKNGIRVNGVRCTVRHLSPRDTLSVARHKLVIDYDPGALGAVGPTPPPDPF
jgi:hypothetical protein